MLMIFWSVPFFLYVITLFFCLNACLFELREHWAQDKFLRTLIQVHLGLFAVIPAVFVGFGMISTPALFADRPFLIWAMIAVLLVAMTLLILDVNAVAGVILTLIGVFLVGHITLLTLFPSPLGWGRNELFLFWTISTMYLAQGLFAVELRLLIMGTVSTIAPREENSGVSLS